MGKGHYFTKPPRTGDEYVYETSKFMDYTLFLLQKMPSRMETYYLAPIADVVSEIEETVVKANAVYINPVKQKPEDCINAYKERDALLRKAIRLFDVYDRRFDTLMSNIDLMASEKSRMKKILKHLIETELAVDQDTKNIDINVVNHPYAIEYKAQNGKEMIRMGIDNHNVKHLLRLEKTASDEIKKRLSMDIKHIKDLVTSSA